MSDVFNTIEEISLPKTSSDLWDELYSDFSAASRMLAFFPDTVSRFRLLGKLYRGKRVYIPQDLKLAKIMSSNDLMKCLRGDMSFFLSIAKDLASKVPSESETSKTSNYNSNYKSFSHSIPTQKLSDENRSIFIDILDKISSTDKRARRVKEILSELFRLVTAEGWQPCLFSNAYLIEQNGNTTASTVNRMFITCLPSNLCRDIFRSVAESSKSEEEARCKKISGMLAHDIIVARKGDKFKTHYDVKISVEEYFMPKDWVSHVLKRKLLDPRLLVKEINGRTVRNQNGFIYKIEKDCSLPDEMMSGIQKEIDEMKEVECLRSVEEHFNELPEEAFQSPIKSTIGSLEL